MTFTEAAIEVLRREGKPLHFKKIAEIAVRESLLDHIGKIPEDVMGGQLANHCRLPRTDRHVMVVQAGTFALVEWGLDEDPQGLDGIFEPPPENEPAYRPRERHPIPSKEMARTVGRGAEQRARRREEGEERRGRRFPPPAEVAFEILAGAERPLTLVEIAGQGAERALMPDAFVRDTGALAAALAEDNRRREAAGRKALFALAGDAVSLAAQPEPGERAAVIPVARPAAAADMRRAGLLALRRRLRECDGPTLEYVAAQLLEKLGYRELKVAKRGREHVVYTARRKMGLTELRHCVRVMRGAGEIARREVTEVRRDIGNYGAQIGIILSAGEPNREARGDATAAGQLPVVLLCGDALAEAMVEAAVGCRLVVVPEVDEAFFKDAADTAAQEEAARKARREDRERREPEGREGREPREGREGREGREPREGRDGREERRGRGEERGRRERPSDAAALAAVAAPDEAEGSAELPGTPEERDDTAVAAAPAVALAEGETVVPSAGPVTDEAEDGDDEGDEEDAAEGEVAASGSEASPSAGEGEPRKRRRRRRRRGGRGRGERREGAAGAGAGAGAAANAAPGPAAEASAAGGDAPADAAPGPAPVAVEPARAPAALPGHPEPPALPSAGSSGEGGESR